MPTLRDVAGTHAGRPALVVGGGPDGRYVHARHFGHPVVVGTNFAARVRPCDYVLVVKDYILDQVKALTPAARLAAPTYASKDPQYLLWEHSPEVTDDPDKLFCDGGVVGALHLAARLGCSPVFVAGAEMCVVNGEYHPPGYWATTGFEPMGRRTDPAAAELIWTRQAKALDALAAHLRDHGTAVFHLSPRHWRWYATDHYPARGVF